MNYSSTSQDELTKGAQLRAALSIRGRLTGLKTFLAVTGGMLLGRDLRLPLNIIQNTGKFPL